jgi:DNA ligase-1
VRRLALALDTARMRRSRIEKERAIGEALAAVASEGDEALRGAARLSAGRLLPIGDNRSLGVGFSILLEVAGRGVGYPEAIVAACAGKTGELAEAFALLLARVPGAEARSGLKLEALGQLGDALAAEPGRAGKRALLEAAFAVATPVEAKYLAKAMGGGMRIGAQDGVVQGAIARAFDVPADQMRRVAALVTDPGDLAVLASRGRLAEAVLSVGRPVAFMLATPLESVTSFGEPSAYALEDKIDGVRAQAHRTDDGRVELFARSLDRITEAFPEVVVALRRAPTSFVLDGEIVAVDPRGRPRPFQALQPRLKKGAPSQGDLAETTVCLVAFDLLHDDGDTLLDRPWSERRARLEALVGQLHAPTVVLSRAESLPSARPLRSSLDEAYIAARSRGHEGIVLKRTDAAYDAGRRGQAWIKVKQANATLDVVVVAAERGHGRRAGVLSDYTFAMWREGELVPVGKAYSGLTDDEIDAMTRRLEASTVEQRGGLHVVRPEIVLEVGFDGVQRSSRHASGFALRFPRIVRIRDDKGPESADSLSAVEAIFEAQVASGHREKGQGEGGPRVADRKRGKRRKGEERQLTLFGEDER